MTDSKSSNYVRIHIWVRGRVQGVGFRAFAQHSGAQLDLTGWVRNVGDDRVEIVAEGSHESLERFAEEMKSGPRAGYVEEAKVEWEAAQGEFKNFSVKYNFYN